MKVRPAALILKDNSVLLMQYKYDDADVFGLPGGNPDPGETLAEALKRELNEELGVEIEVKEMCIVGEVCLPQLKNDVLHCVFEAHIVVGDPRPNPAQTTAIGAVWLPVESLGSLNLYPNVGRQIEEFLKNQNAPVYVGKIDQKYFR